MTKLEALLEAKKRWGENTYALCAYDEGGAPHPSYRDHYIVGNLSRAKFRAVQGRGASWEEAFQNVTDANGNLSDYRLEKKD